MSRRDAADKALQMLGDRSFVVENLPGVVGLKSDRVTLSFRRWIFGFKDNYIIRAAYDPRLGASEIVLEGEKSRLRMVFRPTPLGLEPSIEYNGPRRRIVLPRALEAARKLASAALEKAEKELSRVAAEREAAREGGAVDRLMGDIGWIADLVMRGSLIATVKVEGGPGLMDRLLEVAKKYEGGYEAVYLSGRTSDGGEVRVLVKGGRPLGVYVKLGDGSEHYGPEALERVSGGLEVRVYGILVLPRREIVG